jgi:hypothetical protein
LERSGYVERSFFQTGSDGVALVTRLERIRDDGSPFDPPERWPVSFNSDLNLAMVLRGLFYADPGRYRIIVFVLQGAPFAASAAGVTGDEARAWLRKGANVLPREIAERPFGDSTCTALVYEFKNDLGADARAVDSALPGKQHLEKAGILGALLAKRN